METNQFTEKDLKDLIEWMQTPAYLLEIFDSSSIKTTEQLFQAWKEQRFNHE